MPSSSPCEPIVCMAINGNHQLVVVAMVTQVILLPHLKRALVTASDLSVSFRANDSDGSSLVEVNFKVI